jgi:hypothetical protein
MKCRCCGKDCGETYYVLDTFDIIGYPDDDDGGILEFCLECFERVKK